MSSLKKGLFKYKLGEIVYAKKPGKYGCSWAGKIVGLPADVKVSNLKYIVYFYGFDEKYVCIEENIFPYKTSQEQHWDELEASNQEDEPMTWQEMNDCIYRAIKIEHEMIDFLSNVKKDIENGGCLKSSLESLDGFVALDISSIMIEKHPNVVSFLESLTTLLYEYTPEEGEGPEERELFENRFQAFRSKVNLALDKIKKLFFTPSYIPFEDFFHRDMERFTASTKYLQNEMKKTLTLVGANRIICVGIKPSPSSF